MKKTDKPQKLSRHYLYQKELRRDLQMELDEFWSTESHREMENSFFLCGWLFIEWIEFMLALWNTKHHHNTIYSLDYTFLMEVHCLFQDLIYLQIGMCLRTIQASWVPQIPAKKLWSSTIVVRYYFLLLLIYFRGSWYLDLSRVSPDITSSNF